MTQAAMKSCELCKAPITPEQIIQRQAGLVKGVLLCPPCVEQKRREAIEAQKAAGAHPGIGANATQAAPVTTAKKEFHEEPNSLVEAGVGGSSGLIRSFAASSTLGGVHTEANLKRPMSTVSEPPTRCRTFNGKLTPAALAHMDAQINEWLDAHPDIFIKHVVSAVGPFEAKHVEQHLILTIFY